MANDIEEFYNKTKLKSIASHAGRTPVEYIHIFHKEYPRFPSVKLSRSIDNGEYNRLLRTRKSERRFSNKPVSIKILAKILSSCRIIDANPERRTYPSAGARFPVEIYVVAMRLNGLRQGIYHLNIKNFALETLLSENLRQYETELASQFLKNVAGVVILTSVLSRSEVKYGLKAYPYSLLEAGYIGQNIQLSCSKYGIGSCAVGGFINDRVIELLDLTSDELPIHVIAFGSRKKII